MAPPLHQVLQLLSRLAGWLNHDFCPGANRWVNWLKHPTVPLITAAVAALICGTFVNPSAFLLAAALGAVLLLGVVWPWLGLRGLRAVLEFDHRRATEGEPTTARLTLSNRCPWPVWGLTLDRGFRRFGDDRTAWALARVPGWSTSEFRVEFVPDSRGEFPCEPARLRTAFPFGLWHAQCPVTVPVPLLVWPRIVPLESIPDAADLCDSQDQLSPRRVGEAGDLMGTRLFRQGDSLRRVHWSQTARQGKLIVCERQAPAQSAVRVEVDLDPRVHSSAGPEGTLEWTIRTAASICLCLREHHARVECVLGSERVAWPEGPAGEQRMLDQFARLPFEGRPAAAGSHPSGRGSVWQVVCTTPEGQALRQGQGGRAGVHYVTVPSPDVADHGPQTGGETPVPSEPGRDQASITAQIRRQWERSCHVFAH